MSSIPKTQQQLFKCTENKGKYGEFVNLKGNAKFFKNSSNCSTWVTMR